MKNFLNSLWILFAVFALGSCSHTSRTTANSAGKATKGDVIVLNKTDFLAKVFNYEKNPDRWVYEGDKPCIIDFYADWC